MTEFSPYIAGKYYSVPCLRFEGYPIRGFRIGEWTPIVLPIHSDPELAVPEQHYHYDFRFIAPRRRDRIFGALVITLLPCAPYEIRWLKKQCYAPDALGLNVDRDSLQLTKLARKIAIEPSTALIDGHICPHRGVSLQHCPAIDGVLVCPGHGLRFDADSKKLLEVR